MITVGQLKKLLDKFEDEAEVRIEDDDEFSVLPLRTVDKESVVVADGPYGDYVFVEDDYDLDDEYDREAFEEDKNHLVTMCILRT